jgi:small conductance mechanosensitive channel
LELKDRALNYVETHGPKLLGAIIILAAGIFVARSVGNLMMKWLSRKELALEPPVRMLITRGIKLLVIVFAAVIAAGVEVGPLVAGIGVAGVGIGLALQGVLGNMFAGLAIIFLKPFRVGEYIELIGVQGQVTQIELFSTTLLHPDRSRVVVPNRKILGEILHNYGTIRQLSLSVGVAYGTNMAEALALVREVVNRNARVLKDPAPAVGISGLGDSSVTIAVGPWVAVADYGPAGAELNLALLEACHAKGVEIPFPQREVWLMNAGSAEITAGTEKA